MRNHPVIGLNDSSANPGGTRILVCTAGYGEGHNTAARSLVSAFEAAAGPGTAKMIDIFALATPRTDVLVRLVYLRAINRTPKLWSRLYRWIDHADIFPRHNWLMRGAIRHLGRVLERESPAAICCTYPAYAFMLNDLMGRAGRMPPWFNVVTDSISINSLWWKSPCAGWFLPNHDSAEVVRSAGIPSARLHVAGFPVAPFFSEHEGRLVPPDLGAGASPRILYIINSGTVGAEETARVLLAEPGWEVTCAVGRDEKLRKRLVALAANRETPSQIFGWTDQIPRLLMTHHVVVSKAGGATVQEALAARCPMIVNQIVPGQEEGNYELLRRHGVGALAQTPATVRNVLREAFADRAAVWRRWRTAIDSLARPEAARLIADHVLAATGEKTSHAIL